MRLLVMPHLLLSIYLLSLLQSPTFAIQKSYVVYLGQHSHGSEPTLLDVELATNSHYELLGSVCKSVERAKEKIFYSYTNTINGFAAILEEEEAAELAKNPNVLSVFLDKGVKLHTTQSWNFLGVEKNGLIPETSIWVKARFGADAIIANLDTGVWPESPSFSDEGLGPIPSHWKGSCPKNDTLGVRCNRKLIGARYFNKGYAAYVGQLNSTFYTACDIEGHGSHTLSTAGGNFVPGASVFGNGYGTAKGGSPKARVAAYKVCWPPTADGNSCLEADILAAFDAAIGDGVNVISASLGGDPVEFANDGLAIGSFHAVKRGITVVASAGNEGPGKYTVSNVAPWILTVGASTIDRDFGSYVALGNRKHLKGVSLSSKGLPAEKFYPLIWAADAKTANASSSTALLCEAGTLDPKKVKGKILVCLRGEIARVEKGLQARLAGAVGMILANDEQDGNEVIADPHVLPAVHVNFSDGEAIFSYINSTKNPMAFLTRVRTELGTKPAPVMAAFSSRGPSSIEPLILKPDITGPGVNIIAAYTLAVSATDEPYDKRRTPFVTMSGTSMSCPHVSGIVGLLKTLHPDWSPAAIKSAIMTTAARAGNDRKLLLDSSNRIANAFDYGAGHVNPVRAMDPGLVFDLTVNDYLNFLCWEGYTEDEIKLFSGKPYKCPKSFQLADFNYPAIIIPNFAGILNYTRTLKNVGSPGTYKVRVKAPHGLSVSVTPTSYLFKTTGEEKTFKITVKLAGKLKPEDYILGNNAGEFLLTDGKHHVRCPIVFMS